MGLGASPVGILAKSLGFWVTACWPQPAARRARAVNVSARFMISNGLLFLTRRRAKRAKDPREKKALGACKVDTGRDVCPRGASAAIRQRSGGVHGEFKVRRTPAYYRRSMPFIARSLVTASSVAIVTIASIA